MASGKQIIGYEIGEKYCQISYFNERLSEPQTLETNRNNYQIPLMIGKKDSEWVFGTEAEALKKQMPGYVAEDLLRKTWNQEKIQIGDESFDAILLFYQYIKMTLDMLDDCDYIVFTLPRINENIVMILKRIAQKLGMRKDQIYIQDYKESFCYYMFYQPKELWQYEASLFYCSGQKIYSYMLRKLDVGFGKESFVTVEEVEQQEIEELKYVYPLINKDMAQVADVRFKVFVEHVFEKKIVSSVYLTGSFFENNWYPNSLKVICNGRRAFLGNNLYSKGACYTAFRRVMKESTGPVYLDSSELLERISVRARAGSQDGWQTIVDWGVHWYESDCSYEFLADGLEAIEFQIDSLLEGTSRTVVMPLDGIPKRKGYTIRLLMEIVFENQTDCRVSVRDMGFGEFYPPTSFAAETLIKLGENDGEFSFLS